MKLLKILLGLPKTLYVNFRVLPFRQAVRLPIWVTCDTRLSIVGVKLKGEIKPFLIRIGFHECDESNRGDTTLLKVHGELVFEGRPTSGVGRRSSSARAACSNWATTSPFPLPPQ